MSVCVCVGVCVCMWTVEGIPQPTMMRQRNRTESFTSIGALEKNIIVIMIIMQENLNVVLWA